MSGLICSLYSSASHTMNKAGKYRMLGIPLADVRMPTGPTLPNIKPCLFVLGVKSIKKDTVVHDMATPTQHAHLSHTHACDNNHAQEERHFGPPARVAPLLLL